MISLEEIRKDLGEYLTDEQAERLRGSLYELVETLLGDYIENSLLMGENGAETKGVDKKVVISSISRL